MEKKKVIFIIMSIAIVCTTIFGISKVSNWYNTKTFISKIEENSIMNEEEKSLAMDIYNDSDISDKDKEEFVQLIEKYPELFFSQRDFNYETNEFSKTKSAFEVVVQNVTSYIEQTQYGEPYCVVIRKEDATCILKRTGPYNSYVLELNSSVYQKMKKIEEYFDSMGYKFSTIRIENNTICFDTETGEYAVIYSLDSISPEEKGMNVIRNRKYDTVNIIDNWYYRIFKEYI